MKRRGATGYTIIEVMIVLAVSGALFVSTALMLSGKQAQNEVNQSIRDFQSRLQTIASDVANGYYPSGFTCTPLGSSVVLSNTPSPFGPGGNAGCIFVGKIISLKLKSEDIITLIGRQKAALAPYDDVKTLAEANPVVAANSTVTSITETYTYQYNLQIQKAVSVTNPATNYKAVAFVVEFGGGVTSATGSGSASGSRGVLLYGIPGTASTNITQDLYVSPSALVPVPGGVHICLLAEDGRKAEVTIGEGNNQTSTNVLVDTGVGSEC